jgi:hypothetical protein
MSRKRKKIGRKKERKKERTGIKDGGESVRRKGERRQIWH